MSSGEVILIDTRQHWMAAVRFALKPILLLVAVALLALLNNWLNFDGALSFINDIVSFLLIIAAIVALIWLPIDLVRWYSRHYVLTSRRAIRMQGVLRKQSFDSSLEQINDIAFSQSVLGRTLGYADLTLYTASDTANETYDQLMDGLQFKKAVLDAKEALRLDAPLTALAEGFIVKGGTNEASMRADGRLQAPTTTPADQTPPTAAPTAAAAPVAPQDADPLARLEEEPAPPVAQAAPAPAPVAEPAQPSAPEPVAEPAVVVDSEPAPEPEPEPAPQPEPAPEPEASGPEERPDGSSEAWPSADPAAGTGSPPEDAAPADDDGSSTDKPT